MPKIVDHEERRRIVAEAVLRVAADKGVAGVTLNDVSAEAGWSRGVLTHYFGNKDSLLEAALRQGMRQISANLQIASAESDSRRALEMMLLEILPVDDRRLAFSRVYLSFMAEAIVSEHLQDYFSYNHDAWRTLLSATIIRGQQQREISADLDPDMTADSLAAIAEGLRMRAMFATAPIRRELRTQLTGCIDALLPIWTSAMERVEN